MLEDVDLQLMIICHLQTGEQNLQPRLRRVDVVPHRRLCETVLDAVDEGLSIESFSDKNVRYSKKADGNSTIHRRAVIREMTSLTILLVAGLP